MTKILKLRLGGKCNQHCSFCHSNKNDSYELNPKLIPFIKYNHFDKINYGGGEPLIYWDTIKYFINKFPNMYHHIVTNGSLFNEEMLEYTFKYDLRIGLSLNDFTNLSAKAASLLSKVSKFGYGIVYTGEKTLDEIDSQMDEMNSILNKKVYSSYNLMHTTNTNTMSYTKEQADKYIDDLTTRIQSSLYSYVNGNKFNRYNIVTRMNIQNTFANAIPGCLSTNFVSVSLDGRFMECSYDGSYTDKTVDQYWIKYPKYNYSSCYTCPLKGKCKTCYKNKNDMECYIYNKIYNNILTSLTKFKIKDTVELYRNLNMEVT